MFFVLKQMKYECFFFFFQAEDGIRDADVTGVQTCALPISSPERENELMGAYDRSECRLVKEIDLCQMDDLVDMRSTFSLEQMTGFCLFFLNAVFPVPAAELDNLAKITLFR